MEQASGASIGVIGHRPNRLKSADIPLLSSTLRSVLVAARNCLSARARPQAISSLAEGADRLFAEQAIDLGFHLLCPMPFAQSEYEKDFSGAAALELNSLRHFRRLLNRAHTAAGLTRLELPGARDEAVAAYGAAGRSVLEHASTLIVFVWDGRRERRPEGTEEMLEEARRREMNMVWIEAAAPHSLHHWTDHWTLVHKADLEGALRRSLK